MLQNLMPRRSNHRPSLRGKGPLTHESLLVVAGNRKEWKFMLCPEKQRGFCIIYEFAREARRYRRDAPIYTGVMELRRGAADPKSFDELVKVALNLEGPWAWKLLVAFPEWPRQAWLKIAEEERERRLAILLPGYYPSTGETDAKDIIPARLPHHLVDRSQATLLTSKLGFFPVGFGCWSMAEVGLMNLKAQPIDWSHLELAPDEAPEAYLGAIVLRNTRSRKSLHASLDALFDRLGFQKDPPQLSDELLSNPHALEGLTVYRLRKRGLRLGDIKRLATLEGFPGTTSQWRLGELGKKAMELIEKYAS